MPIPEQLQTERLLLRRPQATDADALGSALERSLPELSRAFRWADVHRRFGWGSDGSGHLHDRMVEWEEGRGWIFFAFEKDDPESLVGEICLHTDFLAHRSLTYGVWVRSDLAGRGYAAEASHGVFEAVFANASVEFVEAQVSPRNPRSRMLLEHLGFERHGNLADYDRMVLFEEPWRAVFEARGRRR